MYFHSLKAPTFEKTFGKYKKETVELFRVNLKPIKVVLEPVRRDKPDEKEPVFAGLKLKKAKVIKRTIEKSSLEKIELVHQQFEKEPTTELVRLKLPHISTYIF